SSGGMGSTRGRTNVADGGRAARPGPAGILGPRRRTTPPAVRAVARMTIQNIVPPFDSADERMVGYAHRRRWVGGYHEEAKELLGWDPYQGRLWPGFHRHAVSVMLA